LANLTIIWCGIQRINPSTEPKLTPHIQEKLTCYLSMGETREGLQKEKLDRARGKYEIEKYTTRY